MRYLKVFGDPQLSFRLDLPLVSHLVLDQLYNPCECVSSRTDKGRNDDHTGEPDKACYHYCKLPVCCMYVHT